MNRETLNEILEKHKKWLNNEQDGKRANLSGADLSGADLSGANLSGANLRNTSTQSIRGLDVFSVDNIGTFNGKATYIPSENVVFAGCWKGTLDEFLEKGLEVNKDEKQKQKIQKAYEFFKACE